MKVLFIVHRFHPNLFYPIKALIEAGHNVHMIVPDVEEYKSLPEDYSFITPVLLKDEELSVRNIKRILKDIKPDILLQRHFEGKWKLFSILAFFMGIKRVKYDQSPLTGNSFLKQYTRPLRQFPRTFMFNKITPVLNRGYKGKYTEPFTKYVPFPIEPTKNFLQKSEIRGHIKFLAIGKLGQPRKNHLQIIDALEKLDADCSLTIVGAGRTYAYSEEGYYNKLISRIENTTIKHGINLLSDLPYKEMNSIYESHHILIFPSENESLGQAILEAMANGCPVIASDSCGASGYIQDKVNGFIFKCNNTEELTEKISFFVNNPEEIANFGRKGLDIVRTEHCPEIFVKRIEALIR